MKVWEQLEQVRRDGPVNMLDRHGVMRYANDMEFYDLVCWMAADENKDAYARGLFDGFNSETPADEDGE
jgi:hypothetical protein